MSISAHNTRVRGMFAAMGPDGQMVTYPLNADYVMLGKIISYDSVASKAVWTPAWEDVPTDIYESLVYMSNEGILAETKCKYVADDLIIAYRSPKPGTYAGDPSLIVSDWLIFMGGAGDVECSPGVTLYSSKIIITADCEDPEAAEHIILTADKLIQSGSAAEENPVDLKSILRMQRIPIKLCTQDTTQQLTVEVVGTVLPSE